MVWLWFHGADGWWVWSGDAVEVGGDAWDGDAGGDGWAGGWEVGVDGVDVGLSDHIGVAAGVDGFESDGGVRASCVHRAPQVVVDGRSCIQEDVAAAEVEAGGESACIAGIGIAFADVVSEDEVSSVGHAVGSQSRAAHVVHGRAVSDRGVVLERDGRAVVQLEGPVIAGGAADVGSVEDPARRVVGERRGFVEDAAVLDGDVVDGGGGSTSAELEGLAGVALGPGVGDMDCRRGGYVIAEVEGVEAVLCVPAEEAVIHVEAHVAGSDLNEAVSVAAVALSVAVVEGVLRIGHGHVERFDRDAAVPVDRDVREVHGADGLARGVASAAVAIPACSAVADDVDVGCAEDVGAEFVEMASEDAIASQTDDSNVLESEIGRALGGQVVEDESAILHVVLGSGALPGPKAVGAGVGLRDLDAGDLDVVGRARIENRKGVIDAAEHGGIDQVGVSGVVAGAGVLSEDPGGVGGSARGRSGQDAAGTSATTGVRLRADSAKLCVPVASYPAVLLAHVVGLARGGGIGELHRVAAFEACPAAIPVQHLVGMIEGAGLTRAGAGISSVGLARALGVGSTVCANVPGGALAGGWRCTQGNRDCDGFGLGRIAVVADCGREARGAGGRRHTGDDARGRRKRQACRQTAHADRPRVRRGSSTRLQRRRIRRPVRPRWQA